MSPIWFSSTVVQSERVQHVLFIRAGATCTVYPSRYNTYHISESVQHVPYIRAGTTVPYIRAGTTCTVYLSRYMYRISEPVQLYHISEPVQHVHYFPGLWATNMYNVDPAHFMYPGKLDR